MQKSRGSTRASALLLVLVLLAGRPSAGSCEEGELTKEQWLEDLEFVVSTIKEHHPDPFYRISEEEFEAVVSAARKKIADAPTGEASAVAIMQAIASLEDGHTRLLPRGDNRFSRWFPVRFYKFTDGIFITEIEEQFADCIGARVQRIGGLPAGEAFDHVDTVISADNEFRGIYFAPLYLSNSQILIGLEINDSPDELSLDIITTKGNEQSITLTPFTADFDLTWRNVTGAAPGDITLVNAFSAHPERRPLHLTLPEKFYWFEHLKKHRAVYMQFSKFLNQEDETFDDFRSRMWTYIDAHADEIDLFILDLRYNSGGNGMMLLPFLNEIIQRDHINAEGHLFALTGRNTYSASVILMSVLFLHTETLFVGEPAGSGFNLFSDSRSFGRLPNSGYSLRVATEYFQLAWPANKHYTFPPHYPAPFSSRDYFTGRDPALDAIFNGRVRTIDQVLETEGPRAALAHYDELDIDWGVHRNEWSFYPFSEPGNPLYRESDINRQGYRLLNEEKYDQAIALFELNTRLFPTSFNTWDSLGEGYMKKGLIDEAIGHYERSLELNPRNTNAVEMLIELRGGN